MHSDGLLKLPIFTKGEFFQNPLDYLYFVTSPDKRRCRLPPVPPFYNPFNSLILQLDSITGFYYWITLLNYITGFHY